MTRIALLTPYSGSNLGDGAIQDAVIDNLRHRWPTAEIAMFTAHPESTSRLHGVPSLPLTGIYIPGYSRTLIDTASDLDMQVALKPTAKPTFVQRIKAHRVVATFLRRPYLAIKAVGQSPSTFVHELRYIVAAYRQARDFDLIIVSGGGQIDDYWGGAFGHPYTLFRWALLARATGAPMVFLSVGVCTLDSRLSRYFVNRALKLAAYRSYRDDVSKQKLSHLNFTRADAVFPDLAFSHPMARFGLARQKCAGTGKWTVGVSPIAYLSSEWPRHDAVVHGRYLACLATFTLGLLQAGCSVLVFATDAPDWITADQLYAEVSKIATGNETGTIHRVSAKSVDALQTQLLRMDFVVTSRLHGVILSHLLAIPVLAISYDRKVDSYMREMDQMEYCVDIHSCVPTELVEAFRLLSERRAKVSGLLRERVAENVTSLDRLYDRVGEFVERPRQASWRRHVGAGGKASVER